MPTPPITQPKANPPFTWGSETRDMLYREKPPLPTASPQVPAGVGSLKGTLTAPQGVPAPQFGGEVPPEYAGLLEQQMGEPVQQEQGPGGLDMVLAALGGLLSGNPGAIFSGLLQVRAAQRKAEQQNMEAMQKRSEANRKLYIEGLDAMRQAKIDDLRGREQDLARAGEELSLKETRAKLDEAQRGLDLDRYAARLEESERRLNAKSDELKAAGREDLVQDIDYFRNQALMIGRSLAAQYQRGDPEPVIYFKDQFGEPQEVRGYHQITGTLEAQLQMLTDSMAMEDALDLRDFLYSSMESVLDPVLESWRERTEDIAVQRATKKAGELRGKGYRLRGEAPAPTKPKTTPRPATIGAPTGPISYPY